MMSIQTDFQPEGLSFPLIMHQLHPESSTSIPENPSISSGGPVANHQIEPKSSHRKGLPSLQVLTKGEVLLAKNCLSPQINCLQSPVTGGSFQFGIERSGSPQSDSAVNTEKAYSDSNSDVQHISDNSFTPDPKKKTKSNRTLIKTARSPKNQNSRKLPPKITNFGTNRGDRLESKKNAGRCFNKHCVNFKNGSALKNAKLSILKIDKKGDVTICDDCLNAFNKGYYCPYCHQIFLDSENSYGSDDMAWIQCCDCHKWLHMDCLPQKLIGVDEIKFKCEFCQKQRKKPAKQIKTSTYHKPISKKLNEQYTSRFLYGYPRDKGLLQQHINDNQIFEINENSNEFPQQRNDYTDSEREATQRKIEEFVRNYYNTLMFWNNRRRVMPDKLIYPESLCLENLIKTALGKSFYMTENEINTDLEMLGKDCNYCQRGSRLDSLNGNQIIPENVFGEESKIETSGAEEEENGNDPDMARKKGTNPNNKYKLRVKPPRARYEQSEEQDGLFLVKKKLKK